MVRVNDTKQRLIDAATRLVWEHSYGAVGVEEICEKAGVKKGSFYHFFESKAELVVAALNSEWQESQRRLDAVFSPSLPPLERFKRYFEMIYQKQHDMQKQCGQVLGCLATSIGCEVSKQEPLIGNAVCDLISKHCRFIETTLRDAIAEGLIPDQDVKTKAKTIFACVEGLLTQSRILNDPEVLKSLPGTVMAMIGAPASASLPQDATAGAFLKDA